MSKNDRFEKVYSQGAMTVTEIWVDKETFLMPKSAGIWMFLPDPGALLLP